MKDVKHNKDLGFVLFVVLYDASYLTTRCLQKLILDANY